MTIIYNIIFNKNVFLFTSNCFFCGRPPFSLRDCPTNMTGFTDEPKVFKSSNTSTTTNRYYKHNY